MVHALKRLPATSVDHALSLAAHYRALNQPEEAESICLDVLDVDPDHEGAWRLFGLAITDRFGQEAALLEQAVEAFQHLRDERDRVYHTGVAWERAAKAHLSHGEGHNALTALEHAMGLFERAESLRPDLADPVLHFNRCVRLLASHPLLRAAIELPREHDVRFGD